MTDAVHQRRLPAYAVITPARDEAEHFERTARSLVQQSHRPTEWIVVDDGSTDGTRELAERYARRHDWIRVIGRPRSHARARGAPIVEAFEAGRRQLSERPEITVKLDADLSLPPHYFEAVAQRFAIEPSAGIVGGVAYIPHRGGWRRDRVAAHNVNGVAKAYRTDCLEEIGGLRASMGWDGIDEYAARARGWTVDVLEDLSILHHRPRGSRQPWHRARWEEGLAAHYMGYGPLFLAVRAAYRMAVERPPVLGGLALAAAYAYGHLRGLPQVDDAPAREELRSEQRMRLRALVRPRSRPPGAPAGARGSRADFSVVICTRNRPGQLAEALDALDQQSFTDFELVVVDQSDEPNPSLEERAAADPRLTVIRDRGRGLSRARNVAWRATRSEWLVFVDDDCLPERGWAAALDREFRRAGISYVAGHVGELDLPRRAGALPYATFPVLQRRVVSGRWVWPFTIGYGVCHAVRRSMVDRLGGWDERLGPGVPDFPAADDMDFNHRLLRAGGVCVLTPEARAHHRQWRSERDVADLYRGYMAAWTGFAVKQLFTGHPVAGAWLYSYGISVTARMFASAVKHRSRFRLAVAVSRARGLLAGTVAAVRRRW